MVMILLTKPSRHCPSFPLVPGPSQLLSSFAPSLRSSALMRATPPSLSIVIELFCLIRSADPTRDYLHARRLTRCRSPGNLQSLRKDIARITIKHWRPSFTIKLWSPRLYGFTGGSRSAGVSTEQHNTNDGLASAKATTPTHTNVYAIHGASSIIDAYGALFLE